MLAIAARHFLANLPIRVGETKEEHVDECLLLALSNRLATPLRGANVLFEMYLLPGEYPSTLL
jgi:hypothetical protein